MTPEDLAVHVGNIKDVDRALYYINELVHSHNIPGLTVIRHAMGAILVRSRRAIIDGHLTQVRDDDADDMPTHLGGRSHVDRDATTS